MSINHRLLAEEFSFLCADHITINKFIKSPSDLMNYQTTRSAFIIPIAGEADIIFDGQIFTAIPGKIIHGCPNKKVSFQTKGDVPFEHINLFYTPSTHVSAQAHYINSAFEFTVSDASHLVTLLEEICSLYQCGTNKKHLKRESMIQKLLSLLFPEIILFNSQKQLVLSSVEYIKAHYSTAITLESLSAQFNKTPNQFSYLFYKYMEIRPIDYIIQYRLKVALSLLKEGYQVKEAASKVGYQDAYYFSRLFKKHFNLPPSQIQKHSMT